MGCASSKVLGSEFDAEKGGFSRGISIPTHHQECPDDFHIVALTSSTYGILKVEPPKPPEEEGNMAAHDESVKEVLNKLHNLEGKAETEPQSWLEVSSMLEDLKPGLDQKPTPPSKLITDLARKTINKPPQSDAIDINEIMRDLDEDTGLVKPKSLASTRRANSIKTGNSLPIRTLVELDKCIGGKENSLKTTSSLGTVNLRASLKPIGTANTNSDSIDKTSKDSVVKDDVRKSMSPPTVTCRDGVIRTDSELFDDHFLGSYKSAFPTLSEDDWKAVEICHGVDTEPKNEFKGNVNIDKEGAHAVAKEGQSVTVSAKAEPIMECKEVRPTTPLVASEETKSNQNKNALSELTESGQSGGARPSPLESYEELCPPGGKQAVVLYTTSLRGIRRTYEDCARVREIVQRFGVMIDERDVSMHLEYRNELRELMQRLVTVPRLFINGKYIGGAERVTKLLEEGHLAYLLEGSTKAHCSSGEACDGCAGARFVPCLDCSGSCKVVNPQRQVIRCPDCNENGLIQCPICS